MKKIALLTAFTLLLTGCSATVNIDAAPDANNPACAEVIVRLPDSIDGHAKRITGSQSTGAWGTPTAVLLRCGLPETTVSTLPCITTSEIDWLVDDSNAPSFRFITFGRKPALEVIVDSEKASGTAALDELSAAVQFLPSDKTCS
jgi:hypothetical protein